MSTEQMLIVAVGALWSVTCGSVLYIRTMYNLRIKDCTDLVAKYESRIEKLEADKEEAHKTRDRQMALMEEGLSVSKQQAALFETMYEKLTGTTPTRRRSGGDD